jgi:hypothetical protein
MPDLWPIQPLDQPFSAHSAPFMIITPCRTARLMFKFLRFYVSGNSGASQAVEKRPYAAKVPSKVWAKGEDEDLLRIASESFSGLYLDVVDTVDAPSSERPRGLKPDTSDPYQTGLSWPST